MKPEELIHHVIAGSGESVIRAAAQVLLDKLDKHEAEEGEEKKVYEAILAVPEGKETFTAAMMIGAIAQSWIESKKIAADPTQFIGAVSQKAGNC